MGKATFVRARNMTKLILLTLLPFSFGKQLLATKEDATEFLVRERRWIGDTIDFTGEFNTIATWENFKDGIEEIGLPEAEVDKLETCVTKCYWRNQAKDFIGQAYEEKRENWEEYRTSFGGSPAGTRLIPDGEALARYPKLEKVCGRRSSEVEPQTFLE